MKELVRGYIIEAKWCKEGYVPTFKEYMDVGYTTSGYYAVTVGSFLGMGEIADKNAFEWLRGKPKLVRVSETLARIIDDIASHKVCNRILLTRRNNVSNGFSMHNYAQCMMSMSSHIHPTFSIYINF